MISILVLTLNEERDLPGCLASVRWSDDVWVLDSQSRDGTHAVAEAFGAQVVERKFDNWAAHQNWAMENIPFKHPWVFYLDADERVTDGLHQSLTATVAAPGPHVAFEVQRRDFLDGTWLKHVQLSAWYARLFQPAKMRYERLVNPVSVVDGSTGRISGYLDHFPFSKGVGYWIQRHNDYSTKEAQQLLLNRADAPPFSLRGVFFEKDFQTRRKQQKQLFYRLPGRPVIKFLLIYVAKRGFLDGRAGLTYALLQSIYEYFIVLKTRELQREAELNS
jgi:glycosyltransferase involved in cell wall biosynthesis